jgi:phosphoribosylaminoimidazole-succinocarboxamide synthase
VPVQRVASGKVRDIYAVDDAHLLLVATDRISAYDVVLPTPIPDKGRILTALSAWWFGQLADLIPNHLVAVDDPLIPARWRGRAMLVRRLAMLPIECVARGYLAGSGLADYRATGSVCGTRLPAGLDEGSVLPVPIFTPATKATAGEHDENVDVAAVARLVGAQTARELERVTLAVYARGREIALERGIVVADTKLEFGRDAAGALVLADEVLTPDSSRFWPLASWRPGMTQPSYDKQYVRDWLAHRSGWDRASGTPPPPLPPEVVRRTRKKYVEVYERLTGRPFADWLGSDPVPVSAPPQGEPR